jgi:hypothetical protein
MAEDSEHTGAQAPSEKAHVDRKRDLPNTESPPLSPAGDTAEAAHASKPAIEPTDIVIWQPAARAGFRIRPRHKRWAMMAATVALAAALGAVAGVAASGGFAAHKSDPAIAERQALQQKIGQLGKEIASLKMSVAASEKSARTSIAKISEKLSNKLTERLRNAPDITGSIPVPPAAVATPLPAPRPAVSVRTPVVQDWSIRFVRDGFVYVRQERGDVFQVQIGAPLPGLGPVREVKREDGRWVVVTPKGLIVAMRDRAFFEHF